MAQKMMRFSLPVRLWLWLHYRFTNYHDYLDQTDDQLEGGGGKKTPFLRHFILKMIILPRQARDKHRKIRERVMRFLTCRSQEP